MHVVLYTHSDYFDILKIQLDYFKKTIEPNFYRITLVTNKKVDSCCYDYYTYDESLPYASRLLGALQTITSDYVLVLHENDIILQLNPDTITALASKMVEESIASIELKHDMHSAIPSFVTPTLQIAEKRSDYQYSVQPTIWNRLNLIETLSTFPLKTYRTIEDPDVQEYVRSTFKVCILRTPNPIQTIWYTVDPSFVFLHLTCRLLLLPCRADNGLHPDIQRHHEYIYSTYLRTSTREVQPTLWSFLNHKVEQERLQTKALINGMRVSVIIATHNRFDHLIRAIESVQSQTYKSVEIIVVDDASTDERYKNPHFQDSITYIRLLKGTKEMFGFPSPGYVRSVGLRKASGTYIAFLDDDDVWFPTKLERQLDAMTRTGCRMSTTDAYADYEIYSPTKQYRKFYSEIDYELLKSIYRQQGSSALDNGFPEIWNKQFVETHDCCMTSSVILHRSIVDTIGVMQSVPIGQEDWSYWIRALEHTDSVFIKDPCVYYTRRPLRS